MSSVSAVHGMHIAANVVVCGGMFYYFKSTTEALEKRISQLEEIVSKLSETNRDPYQEINSLLQRLSPQKRQLAISRINTIPKHLSDKERILTMRDMIESLDDEKSNSNENLPKSQGHAKAHNLPKPRGRMQAPDDDDDVCLPKPKGRMKGPDDDVCLPKPKGRMKGPDDDEVCLPKPRGRMKGPDDDDEVCLPKPKQPVTKLPGPRPPVNRKLPVHPGSNGILENLVNGLDVVFSAAPHVMSTEESEADITQLDQQLKKVAPKQRAIDDELRRELQAAELVKIARKNVRSDYYEKYGVVKLML